MLTIRKRAVEPVFDRRGYYRSAVTFSSYRRGKPAPNKGMKLPADPLTREEAHRLMGALGRGAAGARDRALFVMLWRCGLRIAEALALYPKDVDPGNGLVTVLRGKGGRRRVVGIDPEAVAVVDRWLAKRRELGLTGRHALFCVISQGQSFGQPVHASVFRTKLKRSAERAGIHKRVHPHGLRHTYAAELARENVSVLLIQQLLGHADLNTTYRYVNHLSPWEAIDVARNRTWGLTHRDLPPEEDPQERPEAA